MRPIKDVACCQDFPREGYILTHDKLIEVKNYNELIREFEMPPGNAVDANANFCRDSSGLLGTIPSCVIPYDAVIHVDWNNLFDMGSLIKPSPIQMFKKKCIINPIPVIFTIVAGALAGMIFYKVVRK